MKNEELIVVVNIPDVKENNILNLLELAEKHNIKPSKTKKENQHTQFIFRFEESKRKNDFFEAIPIDWT